MTTITQKQWRNAVRSKPFFASVLLALFVFVLAMANSKALHHLMHVDAEMPGHQCAVTLLTSGQIDATPDIVSVSTTPAINVGCVLPQAPFLLAVEYSLLPGRAPPASLT